MARRASDASIRRILARADRSSILVKRQVARAIAALQRETRIERIERALETGDAFAIHDLTSSLPRHLRRSVKTLERLFAETMSAEVASGLGLGIDFSLTSREVIRAAREESASLVTRITDQTRRGIRTLVARGQAEGIPPAELARLIKPLIGLTEGQARAVLRRRSVLLLDGRTRRDASQIAYRYAQRLLRQRAETIARTETIGSATRGQLSAWDAARRRGLVPQQSLVVWTTTPDDRTCPYCREMDGAQTLLGTAFETPLGSVVGPPLHPNCRCAIGLETIALERAA